jgi:hypothetical protein
MNTKKIVELAKMLIDKDELEMSRDELDLVRCPESLAAAYKEINRLRDVIDDLAHDRVPQELKPLLYKE